VDPRGRSLSSLCLPPVSAVLFPEPSPFRCRELARRPAAPASIGIVCASHSALIGRDSLPFSRSRYSCPPETRSCRASKVLSETVRNLCRPPCPVLLREEVSGHLTSLRSVFAVQFFPGLCGSSIATFSFSLPRIVIGLGPPRGREFFFTELPLPEQR